MLDGEVRRCECSGDEHGNHLCSLADKYFHILSAAEFREMVADSRFKCEFCGRTSRSSKNLCYPVTL